MVLVYAEAAELSGVASATGALLIWFYVALFTQSYAKIALVQRLRQAGFGLMSYRNIHYTDPVVARIKYGVPHDSPMALAADRTAGNLMEQLIPFIVATWLRAVLVPNAAASAGRLTWAYLLSRIAYPFAFYAGHPLLQLATQPGYLIVWGQLADIVVTAGYSPVWWSAEGCESVIFLLILVSEMVILTQWAVSQRKTRQERHLEPETTTCESRGDSKLGSPRRSKVDKNRNVEVKGARINRKGRSPR